MPQDRESGKRASQWGLECGKKIIEKLGGKPIRRGSNEFFLKDERLTVHCAHKDTDSVGVTYKTLDRVAAVLAAFEQSDGTFLVLRLPTEKYKGYMQETRSLGPSKGRVGKVKRAIFDCDGAIFARLKI